MMNTTTTATMLPSIVIICFDNPDIVMDICQSIFFAWLLALDTIKDFLINNHFNKDENDKEEEKKDKGKGKATQEQLEQWDREAKASRKSFNSGGNDNDNDDDDEDDYKKREDVRLKMDRLLAQELQDQENREIHDSSSLSSYSILSSEISENDDDLRANRKLDIKELDEKLVEEAKIKKMEENEKLLEQVREDWVKEIEEESKKRKSQEEDYKPSKKKKR